MSIPRYLDESKDESRIPLNKSTEEEENVKYPKLSDENDHPLGFSEVVMVENRFIPLVVDRIEKVEIHKTNYPVDDNTIVRQQGLGFQQTETLRAGMLDKAVVSIECQLFKDVVPGEVLADISSACGVSGYETDILFATSAIPNQQPSDSSSSSASKRILIHVPIHQSLSDKLPLFDRVNLQGEEFTHHTIRIPGAKMQANGKFQFTTWFVRLRLNEKKGTVEVRSISDSIVDSVRVSAAMGSLRGSLVAMKNSVVAWFSSCSERRKKAVTEETALLKAETTEEKVGKVVLYYDGSSANPSVEGSNSQVVEVLVNSH